MPLVPTVPTSRRIARLARHATLGVYLLGLAGCAASRWVDDRTSGDLWGTGGREMGLVTWLRSVPSERPAADDAADDAADAAARDEALLDAVIELAFTGIAIW